MANSTLPMLKISTVESMPYITKEIDAEKQVSYVGFLKDLMDEISRKAKFTYEFMDATGDSYGEKVNGKWNGVMGDVVDKRADIGGQLTVTPMREDSVEFTQPFMSNGVNLLVRKPTWSDLGLGYLVRPLSSDYWIMLLVVLLLIGIVFFIIGKFSPYEWGNVAADKDPRGAKNSFTLRNSYLFALTTLSWQGFREAPKSLSGRIMAAFWLLFVLFTLIAYTANLTAYFMARPEQIPDLKFSNYEDLLLDSDVDTYALQSGSTEEYLRSSRSKTLRSLWTKMNNRGTFARSEIEGVTRVKSTGKDNVFFMETKTAQYVASHSPDCELMVYGETLFPSATAFALPKNSIWRKKINDAIEELRVIGFIDQLEKKYWDFDVKCRNFDGRKYSSNGGYMSSMPVYPVSLKDMAVAILLLFLGFIAAMIFLVIEIVHYAVTKQGKKIEKPKLLTKIERPKIFKPKSKSAKAAPPSVEEGVDPEAGPSSDGLENVPLDGLEEAQEAGTSDELLPEEEQTEKAEV